MGIAKAIGEIKEYVEVITRSLTSLDITPHTVRLFEKSARELNSLLTEAKDKKIVDTLKTTALSVNNIAKNFDPKLFDELRKAIKMLNNLGTNSDLKDYLKETAETVLIVKSFLTPDTMEQIKKILVHMDSMGSTITTLTRNIRNLLSPQMLAALGPGAYLIGLVVTKILAKCVLPTTTDETDIKCIKELQQLMLPIIVENTRQNCHQTMILAKIAEHSGVKSTTLNTAGQEAKKFLNGTSLISNDILIAIADMNYFIDKLFSEKNMKKSAAAKLDYLNSNENILLHIFNMHNDYNLSNHYVNAGSLTYKTLLKRYDRKEVIREFYFKKINVNKTLIHSLVNKIIWSKYNVSVHVSHIMRNIYTYTTNHRELPKSFIKYHAYAQLEIVELQQQILEFCPSLEQHMQQNKYAELNRESALYELLISLVAKRWFLQLNHYVGEYLNTYRYSAHKTSSTLASGASTALSWIYTLTPDPSNISEKKLRKFQILNLENAEQPGRNDYYCSLMVKLLHLQCVAKNTEKAIKTISTLISLENAAFIHEHEKDLIQAMIYMKNRGEMLAAMKLADKIDSFSTQQHHFLNDLSSEYNERWFFYGEGGKSIFQMGLINQMDRKFQSLSKIASKDGITEKFKEDTTILLHPTVLHGGESVNQKIYNRNFSFVCDVVCASLKNENSEIGLWLLKNDEACKTITEKFNLIHSTDSWLLIHRAVYYDNKVILNSILKTNSRVGFFLTKKGFFNGKQNILHIAVIHKSFKCIKFLLKHHPELFEKLSNSKDQNGKKPLELTTDTVKNYIGELKNKSNPPIAINSLTQN